MDTNDACCCDEELPFVENGPACRINYPGDATPLTLELVRSSGSTVLARVASAAECSADEGWFTTSESAMLSVIELCSSTCTIRQSETTRLRVLRGCPVTPC